MIIPKKLKKGDTIAIVSLSSGMGGEKEFYHRYLLGKERLEKVFGLRVITMPNALKGVEYLYKHPEARAKDLMDAFKNKKIKAIITMIGGDDSIRLLPYIDDEVIKNNPKIFIGYSDTTITHLVLYKNGITSYYGPALLSEIAENGSMHEYTKKYLENALFEDNDILIKSSEKWTNDRIDWTDQSKDNDYIPSLKYYYYFDDIGTGYKREELATNKYNEYIFVYNINSEDKNSKFTLNYLGDDSKIRLTPSVLE